MDNPISLSELHGVVVDPEDKDDGYIENQTNSHINDDDVFLVDTDQPSFLDAVEV